MRFLLVALIFLLIVTDAYSLDLSLMPGLSVKNGILYMIVMFLAFRMVVGGRFQIELGRLHVAFAILIGYAILSWLFAAFAMEYPRYHLLNSAIRLKAGPIDSLIFFLAFFYGLKNTQDALAVLKSMLLAVVLANMITVVDALGILHLGADQARENGRVQGAVGESNQFAAFIGLFLPALFAAAALHRGLWRWVWIGGALVSFAALMMTASRGGVVGLVLGCLWAAYIFRGYLSTARLASWVVVIGLVASLAIVALSATHYDALMTDRLFRQTGSVDMSDATSGRTEIWSALLSRMWESPLTLLTGFGWDVYWTMPFRHSPHNQYLNMWFNLGIVGLMCTVFLLAYVVMTAKAAARRAVPPARTYLIAFATGVLVVAIAILFVDLYQPWMYFWAYAGVMMRLAVSVRASEARKHAVASDPPRTAAAKDPFGWVGSRV